MQICVESWTICYESRTFVFVRYFMDISYRGTTFNGWQIQPNGTTVQGEIEKALTILLKTKCAIVGSGRTDTGVHARQQIAHFDTDASIDTGQLAFKLNSFLPADISINSIRLVPEEANARFSAVSRTYHYHIHTLKDPFKKGISYYFKPELDTDRIKNGCEIIANWQNFECFSKVHTDVNHFDCNIFAIDWTKYPTEHLFEVTANRFLRGMVRAMVGTLIDVGLGKTTIDRLKHILKSNDRSIAGRAVPAEGLFLQQVIYPEDIYH